jgi:hypothetical protein
MIVPVQAGIQYLDFLDSCPWIAEKPGNLPAQILQRKTPSGLKPEPGLRRSGEESSVTTG